MADPLIHPSALVGQPFRHFQGGRPAYGFSTREVVLGKDVWIGAFTVIGTGVVLRSGVVVDHHCMIEPEAEIGDNTLIIYRATIGCEAVVGRNCVIGGLICERCVIEDDCRIFGQIVHRQIDTTVAWDEHEVPEPSAKIMQGSFIAFGATIAGGVTIGPHSYVAAGAVVTKNVPPRYVAINTNCMVPIDQWRGPLRGNPGLR